MVTEPGSGTSDDPTDAGETEGVIGQRSGASLQRFPSSVYWNGLHVWGILRFPGTMYQYYQPLDRYYRSRTYLPEIETTELVQESNENWDPNLPTERRWKPSPSQLQR